MGQVAFDTQEFVETLEKLGLEKEQAKAISLVVRKSHEVADLATKADINDVKRDIADVRKDFSAEIVGVKRDIEDVRKEIEFRFEKTDAQIADVRKELSAQIADSRKETATQIDLLRKDVESISTWLLIKMAAMMTALLGVAVTLVKILI